MTTERGDIDTEEIRGEKGLLRGAIALLLTLLAGIGVLIWRFV